ncbi:hypothetical protein BD289DRAFT_47564 [Coniella lustricola]|uniref:Uncharacterized protein n=1 Tax=Coniella lustricola TaxID=2025994 RepID=A0A2T3AIF7_9PEZI|nr:hypothetical protein BD289DRAFT_47564 [Coniella lustricola]
MDARPEGLPLSPIPSAVNPGETHGGEAAHDRPPRASLHSERARTRFGRHSLDVGRSPLSPRSSAGSPGASKGERSNSLPTVNKQPGNSSDPHQTPPIHAPTTTRIDSQRAVRSSAEFNRRFDGPFGRPSLAMTRRFSSHHDEIPAVQGAEAAAGSSGVVPEPTSTTASGGSTPELLEPEPPPLNYTLHTRKKSIFIFWSFIVFDSVVMPIALYFGLWYGVGPGANTPTHKGEVLSANAVFSIVTAAIGGASIVEYAVRFWRLYKKNSTCRVIGAKRWYLDLFHWNYSLAWIIVMVELIVGTCQYWPPIRLLSVPLTTMLFTFGTELLLVDTLRLFRVPAPMRMSSIPKGAQLRPCIYTMIEDVIAVDGSGGTAYREALNRRYEASHIFRAMLRRLGIFWAVGAEAMAVVCMILIFTVSDDAAFAIGWSVPFAWAGVWVLATIWYVKKELKRERVEWAEQVAKSSA